MQQHMFSLTKKEKKKLAAKVKHLDDRIKEHQQDFWDSPPGIEAFLRGDHYAMSDDREDSDSAADDTTGATQTGGNYPVVHYTLSRLRELVTEIHNPDADIEVLPKDIADFPGLDEGHQWAQIRAAYESMIPDSEKTDSHIAAELLDSRLKQFIDNADMPQFWECFLEYAAQYRNGATLAYYDPNDLVEPLKLERVDVGDWGYDPKSKDDVMSGEGCFVVRELGHDEFEATYGMTPQDAYKFGNESDEDAAGVDDDDDDDEVYQDYDEDDTGDKSKPKKGRPVKVKLWFLKDETLVQEPVTEIQTSVVLNTPEGPLEIQANEFNPQELMQQLAQKFGPELAQQVLATAEEVENEVQAIDEDGEPITAYVNKYRGGIKILHVFNNKIIRCEDNWHPLGWCPLDTYAFIRVAGKVMGMSVYDLTKDANQTIDRGLVYFLGQAEASIGITWMNKEFIENVEEVQENGLNTVAVFKGGVPPEKALGRLPGVPVNDATLRGITQVQQLSDDGLGTDKAQYSQAQAMQDNATAQEGMLTEMLKSLVREQKRFERYIARQYTGLLAMSIEYEDDAVTAKIARDVGPPGILEWNPTLLAFPEEEFELRYEVKVCTPVNMPRNPMARAQYRIQMVRTFFELMQLDPDAARLLAQTGDLPWPEDELLEILDRKIAEQQAQGPPPALQLEQAKIEVEKMKAQAKQMEIQLKHKEKMAELNIRVAELTAKTDKDRADIALKQAEIYLEAEQKRAVRIGE